MFKLIKYVATNSVFAYALYAGVYGQSAGWGNIALFMTVFIFVVGILSCTESAKKGLVEKEDFVRTVPASFDMFVTLAFTGVFVYAGWMWSGAMLLVGHMLLSSTINEVVALRRARVTAILKGE